MRRKSEREGLEDKAVITSVAEWFLGIKCCVVAPPTPLPSLYNLLLCGQLAHT